jgi:hypothetical protein
MVSSLFDGISHQGAKLIWGYNETKRRWLRHIDVDCILK